MSGHDDPFPFAVSQLQQGDWSIYGPESFKGEYLRKAGLAGREGKTASYISVQSLGDLKPSLRQAEAMVLRLGNSADRAGTTQFVVIGTPGKLHDFFLIDSAIFSDGAPETYHPEVSSSGLLPYYISPQITEKSAVNLALASGLLGYALALDKPYPTAAPATGSATYTFRFRPHSAMPKEICQYLVHDNGQVEIDAVFVGRRGGRDLLFVLEAKTEVKGHRSQSLAKHKLVYPVQSLRESVPPGMPIVPVYLRASVSDQAVTYRIVQCEFPLVADRIPSLDDLRPIAASAVNLSLSIDGQAAQGISGLKV